jgi:hypothetical protein
MPDYLIIGFFLQLQYRPNRFVDILFILQHAWNIMDNQDFRLASTDLPVIWRHLSFMLYIILLASAHGSMFTSVFCFTPSHRPFEKAEPSMAFAEQISWHQEMGTASPLLI